MKPVTANTWTPFIGAQIDVVHAGINFKRLVSRRASQGDKNYTGVSKHAVSSAEVDLLTAVNAVIRRAKQAGVLLPSIAQHLTQEVL